VKSGCLRARHGCRGLAGELWGQLLAHNPDRRELHRELQEKQVKRAYIIFAGPVVKPGYTVIL
jgi:hypothetical protein